MYVDQKDALHKHVEFFDLNGDGVITPWETFAILNDKLCCSAFTSLALTAFLHAMFSYPTQPTWAPDPFFTIHINKIENCKYRSHSGIFCPTVSTLTTLDPSGVDVKTFESYFGPIKHQHFMRVQVDNQSDKEFIDEIVDPITLWRFIVQKTIQIGDLIGFVCSTVLWYALFYIILDGKITKKDITLLYLGTLFQDLESRHKKNID
jgi:hypothetical protein